MSGISGIGNVPGYNGNNYTGPVSAATALAALRRRGVTSVEISDTIQNITKNLDALQAYASKITALSTTDVDKSLVVSGTQYQKDRTLLDLWGAGSGQTVRIKGALASATSGLASYVTSVSVADSSARIQAYLDQLQTATDSGILSEIVQTGNPGRITLTAAQLTADQGALDKIKNHAYSLAITNASVSDVLGQGATPALATNDRVRSIAIVDTTDNIGDNLDALQKVGLRIRTISQTDADTHLEITGEQYTKDKLVLGKIITSDLLDVMDASVGQLRALSKDAKVVTIDIKDSAAKLTRNWALLGVLQDSLTSVEVSDQGSAISLTADQLSSSALLLGKFNDVVGNTYKLAVTKVSAGAALAVAATHNVDTIDVVDTSANLSANLDDLKAVDGQGRLNSITVSGSTQLSMDVSYLQGGAETTTQSMLDKIKGNNYSLSVTGMSASSLEDLSSNNRVVAMAVTDSSDNLEAALGTLSGLGSRLKSIEQTDSGVAFEITQTQMISYGSVLSKITGGYTANLTNVLASKAMTYANNARVGSISVADTARNLVARWADLMALGNNLTAISQSDAGALSVTADNYLTGVSSDLVSKFAGGVTFSVSKADLAQTQSLNGDSKVVQIEMAEKSSVIAANLATLEGLQADGKLTRIINQSPNESLALDASQITDGQAVFDLIKGGSYSLAVSGVDVADVKDLLAGNAKIASASVSGTGADIVSNLSDLAGLGRRLASITQSDAPTELLEMTGSVYSANATTLAKIQGGYLAVLTDVTASKAAAYAASGNVSSMTVADTGDNLARAWNVLKDMGLKLTSVTQSDASTLQLDANDWLHATDLRGKFGTAPTVSLSGASVAQVASLAASDEVEALQVMDSASILAGAMDDLAAESKITRLTIGDTSQAMSLTAQSYSDNVALISLISNSDYQVELSDVAAADVASLAADTHVTLMDVKDTAENVSASFNDLVAAGDTVNAIELDDVDQTVTLTATQILGQSDTLDKVIGSYNLAATDVAMADLAGITELPQTASIAIKDTSDNVSAFFSDVLALGTSLTEIQFSNATPVLTITGQDWNDGTDALATITGSYDLDVNDVAAGEVQTVSEGANVRDVTVNDTADNVASNWDTLVSLYNGGAGQLKGITLSDANPLVLTSTQQTDGATMIAGLLANETIVTA